MAARTHDRRVGAGPLVLALVVPFVFLHKVYQPSATLDIGSTGATVNLSDLAVLTAVAAALTAGVRNGFGVLRPGLPIQIAGAAFLAWVLAATIYPLALSDHYRFAVHLVTTLKLFEYAALSLAVPLLLRARRDVLPLLATLTAWSVAASTGAVLQFVGLVDQFLGRRPGEREPSFLGVHDLAALSGAALALGFLAVALPSADRRHRLVATVAGISGAVGLTLSGALAGVIGIAAMAAAAAALARRRRVLTLRAAAVLAAAVCAVSAGVFALRSENVGSFLRFVGLQAAEEQETFSGESYVQRSVLAYIGARIFADHPLLGVGWQGTSEEESYGPYVPDARRRFPRAPALSFPSPEHPWGIQTAYLQAAAELGIVGLAAFLAPFALGLVMTFRAAARAPPPAAPVTAVPILWLVMTMGVWLGLGLVAGTPLVGLHWLSLGLAAAAATWTAHEQG